MYFLIDYENVFEAGLRGSEWINENDSVYLFYHEGMSIQTRHLESFVKAKRYEVFKLKEKRANALDFYIAVKTGEIIKETDDLNNRIVIVTKDKGFCSVRDFCENYLKEKVKVISAPDIETGIISCDFYTERYCKIIKGKREASIEDTYKAYLMEKERENEIVQVLTKNGYSNQIHDIMEIVNKCNTPKQRYLSSLKQFGKKGGAIYRILKEVV